MVNLIYFTPLYLISNGIRMSHDNHNLSDTEKKMNDCIVEAVLEDNSTHHCKNIIGEKDFNLIKKEKKALKVA